MRNIVSNTTSHKNLVEFLSIDLRNQGGDIYRFMNSAAVGNVYRWNNLDWVSLPFESTGWKAGGEKPESPKINLPDFDGLMRVELKACRNGLGAPVIRYVVLDPQNNSQMFHPEEYKLLTYTATGTTLSLDIATPMDITDARWLGFKMTRKYYPGLGSSLLR